jgi:galactose mutarotase-like enzyme
MLKNEINKIINNRLLIATQQKGAELTSIFSKGKNFEFLWQARAEVWSRHAPILFPIVGKLSQNKTLYQNEIYSQNQHGFARDLPFELTEIYADLLVFKLESSELTKSQFPYDFCLFVEYQIIENSLIITYKIHNTDSKPIYYTIGAHPGFALPVHKLNEYVIEFEQKEELRRHLLSDGLFNGDTEIIGLDTNSIPLSTSLFDKDAIVFKHLKSSWVKLKHLHSNYEVKMSIAGWPYLGIWTKAGCEEFICLEPWQGLADTVGFTGDVSEKEGMRKLDFGAIESFSYTIEFAI